ncbi:MAG TPA: DUF512 domain-containing protein [bacterium]|nr:DUF512 domain-containing protein [bacterium]
MLAVTVAPGSPAARAGLRGRLLLAKLDGQPVVDALDCRFFSAGERVVATLADGRRIALVKAYDEDPGLVPPPLVPRTCGNRCVFCFMGQQPRGVRAALRLRDEDFRLSFLLGNYITLTNLRPEDWRRIRRLRLSPLYVSVHATDETVRRLLLGNPRAPAILPQLRRLARYGCALHVQIVVCPGLNDGKVLARTVADLARLRPAVASVALVPVGLTAHRAGCYPLRGLTRDEARALLVLADRYDARLRPRAGTGWLYPADEVYFLAGRPFPHRRWYDDFPQLENGVGMMRRLLDRLPRLQLAGRRPYTVLTGVLVAPRLARWARRERVTVVPVANTHFGGGVNVAGLLAGVDLVRALRGVRRGTVFVPASAVNADGLLLDNMPLAALRRQTRAAIRLLNDEGAVVSGS